MGAGGVPNRKIEMTDERSMARTGKPNCRADRYKNGKRVQARWYDKNGNAERNRDYQHSGVDKHFFPHDHIWINGKRQTTQLIPDYDNYPDNY